MYYQELFNLMADEHGLTLLEQDMQEIIHVVNKISVEPKIKHLETIVQEAVNLPKGIEPHSWSDYKANKRSVD
jgi:hypothetical protein